MKQLFYVILISIFCLNITVLSQNPEWINYTSKGLVNTIIFEENFAWIGTTGGLVKINNNTGETKSFDKTNSGLPSNYVTSLAKDHSGILWIGTDRGLVKFDGINWEVFNSSNSVLPYDIINCLAIDESGNKWIGLDKYWDGNTWRGGVVKFDDIDFTIYNTSNSPLPHNTINCITIDEIGNLWIGTRSGLAIFDGTNWDLFNTTNSGLPSNYITCVAIDKSGTKWIGTGGGIAKFDDINWMVYKGPAFGHPANSINCIAVDSSNNVWFGSGWDNELDGLAKFDGTEWVLFDEKNSGLPGEGVSSIAIDENGKKWIGSYNIWGYGTPVGKGLVTFDELNWTKINISGSGLPGNYVQCVTLDEFGNKWIGTLQSGLAKFDDSSWIVYDTSNSELPDNNIMCIAFDTDGFGFIGTRGSGLALFEESDQFFEILNTSNSSFLSDFISCIEVDDYGNPWIGTFHGLTLMDGTNCTESNSELPSNWINCVSIDEFNTKWIGTNGGLAQFDGRTSWDVYNTSNSGLPSNDVSCIEIDETGNKWIGTQPEYSGPPNWWKGGGLAKFDGTNWDVYNESNSGLPSNRIYCIAIDDSDNKWVGTGNGLVKFDGTNWIIYNESNSGLPYKYINCISIDEAGNKWIGTRNGLAVFNEGGIVSVEENANQLELLPSEYVLNQNYPNPFNPSTTIKYSIPNVGTGHVPTVRLIVYDVLGREVATLVNQQQKAGYYEVNWNASTNSSGIYFYKLNAGSFVETKKMILLR